MYGGGKESISTKNTSVINQTTDISVEAKPLSYRKYIEDEQKIDNACQIDKSVNPTNIAGRLSWVSPKRIFNETFHRKPKVADLMFLEDKKNAMLNLFKGNKEWLNNTQAISGHTDIHLPNNFKRIPAMIDKSSKRDENSKSTKDYNYRGKSESGIRVSVVEDSDFHQRNSSQDKLKSIKDYKLGRQIGKGAYSIVKLVTDKATDQIHAMKIYEKYKLTDSARRKSVTREIVIMQKLNHENIVKLHYSFDNPHSIHLVMDYVKGKSLFQYIKEKVFKRLLEEEAKHLMLQIVNWIKYLHSMNIAHRDLKLENLIVDATTKKITLIDFGFSVISNNDK